MEIQAALSVLTLISQEATLIDDLNNCYNFTHNILLADSSADIDRLVGNGNQPKSLFVFKSSADGNITGLEGLREITSKNPFTILVPGSSTFVRNLSLLKQIKNIQRLHKNMKLGIFFQNTTSMYDLRAHFLWFRGQYIPNVFAVTYPHIGHSLNIFTFHSFGKFELINVTGTNKLQEFFPSLDFNYHLHKFRIAPLSHIFQQRFWLSVLKVMNATFIVEDVNYNNHLDYFRNGIDIITRLALLSGRASSTLTYPLVISHENIIVPEAVPYSGFYAYLRMLMTNEFFGYAGGLVVAIVLLVSACRYMKQREFLLFRSLTDVLNLLINDNSNIQYQRLSCAETFLVGPLTFVGFIVVNGYFSNLQSYFTRPFLQPQLRTVTDIYNSPLSIAVPPGWKAVLVESIGLESIDKDWSKRIFVIGSESYMNDVFKLNISSGFVITDSDIKILSMVQRRLNIRGVYDTGVTVSRSLSTFLVSDAILFFDRLNEIVHWTYSSGLLNRWLEEAAAYTEKSVLFQYRKRLEHQRAAGLVRMDFPFFIVYGWISGTFVLIIEILWTKMKERSFNKFQTKIKKRKSAADVRKFKSKF